MGIFGTTFLLLALVAANSRASDLAPPRRCPGVRAIVNDDPTDRFLRLVTHLTRVKAVLDKEAIELTAQSAEPRNPLDFASAAARDTEVCGFRTAIDELLREGKIDWPRVKQALHGLIGEKKEKDRQRTEASVATRGILLPVVEKRTIVPFDEEQMPDYGLTTSVGPDGSLYFLYRAIEGDFVRARDAITGRAIPLPAGTGGAHFTRSASGETLVSCYVRGKKKSDDRLEVVDLKSGKTISRTPMDFPKRADYRKGEGLPTAHPVSNADGSRSLVILSGHLLQEAHLVKLPRGKPQPLELPMGRKNHLVPSRDGHEVYAWGFEYGRLVVRALISGKTLYDGPAELSSPQDPKRQIFFHEMKDGRPLVVIADGIGKMRVVDLSTGKEKKLNIARAEPRSGTFLVDGQGHDLFITESLEDEITIADLTAGTSVRLAKRLKGGGSKIHAFLTASGEVVLAESRVGDSKIELALTNLATQTQTVHETKKLGVVGLETVDVLPDGRVVGLFQQEDGSHDRWSVTSIQLFGPASR